MIDLRSDTVTVPTDEMRKYMMTAQVGDDVFDDDPSVNELQNYVADMFGKESSLYVSSGTMANQISIAVSTQRADEVIVDADSHIFVYEAGAPAVISGVQLRCYKTDSGIYDLDVLESMIRGDDVHFPRTSMICIENTHNRHGGVVIPMDTIKGIRALCDKYGLSFHCDGARLWNSSAATGITMTEYASYFDTVSVCLSKALGAPVGSMIVSSAEKIARAKKVRKMLGGGMRQAGIIASAGLFAIKNHFPFLKNDHDNAKLFAQLIARSEHIQVDLERVQTNIVYFNVDELIDSNNLTDELYKNNVNLLSLDKHRLRAVFHFQISSEDTVLAANKIIEIVNKTANK